MSVFKLDNDTSFEHVIGLLFNNWDALKMAVEHDMGGSSEIVKLKLSDLIKNIYECLRKSGDKMRWSSISDIIEDVMDVGFDVALDDTDDISKRICYLYHDWNSSLKSRTKVIDKLKVLPTSVPIQWDPVRPTHEKQKRGALSGKEPEAYDDGWTLVKRK